MVFDKILTYFNLDNIKKNSDSKTKAPLVRELSIKKSDSDLLIDKKGILN